MEWGTAKGLSVSTQVDQRLNDLRYRDELDRRASAEAQARAKMFTDGIEYADVQNPYDSKKLKDYTYGKFKELSQFYSQNPDAQYNPIKQLEAQRIKREIVDNDIVRRAVATDTARKEYLKDRQESVKNPEQWDMEMLDREGEKFRNYDQYGNPNGLLGTDSEGEQPVIYTRPRSLVDVGKYFPEIGKNIKNYKVVKPKDGNPGEFWTEPDDNELDALTNAELLNNSRSIEIHARKMGLTQPEQVRSYVRDLIKTGFDKEYHIGDANAFWEREFNQRERFHNDDKKPKQESSYTPFEYITDPKTKAGQVNDIDVRKLLGDKPQIILTGNSGAKTDLTGADWNPNGRFVNKNGVTWFLGNVKTPLAVAANKGIIDKYDSDDEAAEGSTSARITSDFIGKATFETEYDKDGKPKKYVNVSYHVPINPNDQNLRQKWNAYVDVDKLVPSAKNPYQSNQNTQGLQVDSKGNVFDSNGKYVGKEKDF